MSDAIPQPPTRKKSRRRSFIGLLTFPAGSRIAYRDSMVTRFRGQNKSSLGVATGSTWMGDAPAAHEQTVRISRSPTQSHQWQGASSMRPCSGQFRKRMANETAGRSSEGGCE